MTFLLDVNVLIALVDGSHIQSRPAHAWFEREGKHAFATCPITENGLLRIVGNPRYPTPHGSATAVVAALESLRSLPGHEFWPDDISLADATYFDRRHVLASSQVTDAYLLALAVAHGGRFATFDRRLSGDTVVDGRKALILLS